MIAEWKTPEYFEPKEWIASFGNYLLKEVWKVVHYAMNKVMSLDTWIHGDLERD